MIKTSKKAQKYVLKILFLKERIFQKNKKYCKFDIVILSGVLSIFDTVKDYQ